MSRTIDNELLARPRMIFFSAAAAFLGGIFTALLMQACDVVLRERTETRSMQYGRGQEAIASMMAAHRTSTRVNHCCMFVNPLQHQD